MGTPFFDHEAWLAGDHVYRRGVIMAIRGAAAELAKEPAEVLLWDGHRSDYGCCAAEDWQTTLRTVEAEVCKDGDVVSLRGLDRVIAQMSPIQLDQLRKMEAARRAELGFES